MYEEPGLTQEDWAVFAEYGRTMYSVQEFEQILLGAVDVDEVLSKEETDEKRLKKVKKLFRATAGQLRRQLESQGTVPVDLLDEIETGVNRRNRLAHHYLWVYRVYRVTNPFLQRQDYVEHLK